MRFIFLLLLLTQTAFGLPRNVSCKIFDLNLKKLPKGEIAYINGMNQRPQGAVYCSEILSEMSGGYNVYTIYNPTHGLMRDFTECFVELYSFTLSPPVKKLHEKWDAFFEQASQEEYYLQFCHSQGAIQVRNALLSYPVEKRQKICVVAIAPAAYIPNEICMEAFHYVSKRDMVPKFDRAGRKRCYKSVFILNPDRKSAMVDHQFLSPTYKESIQKHIDEYLASMGIKDD